MAASKFIPRKRSNDTYFLGLEKHLLVSHYDFLEVKIQDKMLVCKGFCKPTELSPSYHYIVKLGPDRVPKVFVMSPEIPYDEHIHMYPQDNSLCLYYPKDASWTEASHLYNTIIPWTHEWFIFYEIYQIKGKWLYPGITHN